MSFHNYSVFLSKQNKFNGGNNITFCHWRIRASSEKREGQAFPHLASGSKTVTHNPPPLSPPPHTHTPVTVRVTNYYEAMLAGQADDPILWDWTNGWADQLIMATEDILFLAKINHD